MLTCINSKHFPSTSCRYKFTCSTFLIVCICLSLKYSSPPTSIQQSTTTYRQNLVLMLWPCQWMSMLNTKALVQALLLKGSIPGSWKRSSKLKDNFTIHIHVSLYSVEKAYCGRKAVAGRTQPNRSEGNGMHFFPKISLKDKHTHFTSGVGA